MTTGHIQNPKTVTRINSSREWFGELGNLKIVKFQDAFGIKERLLTPCRYIHL